MKATNETIKMMDKALYELCENLNNELQFCEKFSKAEIRKCADRMRGACLLFNSMCEDYKYITIISETNYARLNGIAITLRQMNN